MLSRLNYDRKFVANPGTASIPAQTLDSRQLSALSKTASPQRTWGRL
jgi:hypothetical protein